MSDLVVNPEDRFSRVAAHMVHDSTVLNTTLCYFWTSNGHFKTVCYISIHFTLIITQIYFCGGSFCFMSWCLKIFCAVGALCMFSYF